MPKTPRLTAKEVIHWLKQNGFIEVSQTGSHPVTSRTAIVPIHSKKIIPIGTLKSIEKQADLKFYDD